MTPRVAARISLGVGNIAAHPADGVLCPTDSALTARRGVSGAIHRAAGKRLLAACRAAGPCREGDAVVTPGFDLTAGRVVHAVFPQRLVSDEDRARLRETYAMALRRCVEHEIERLNVPPVSPAGEAGPRVLARLALEAIAAHLARHHLPKRVNVCCFTAAEREAYEHAFEALSTEVVIRV